MPDASIVRISVSVPEIVNALSPVRINEDVAPDVDIVVAPKSRLNAPSTSMLSVSTLVTVKVVVPIEASSSTSRTSLAPVAVSISTTTPDVLAPVVRYNFTPVGISVSVVVAAVLSSSTYTRSRPVVSVRSTFAVASAWRPKRSTPDK